MHPPTPVGWRMPPLSGDRRRAHVHAHVRLASQRLLCAEHHTPVFVSCAVIALHLRCAPSLHRTCTMRRHCIAPALCVVIAAHPRHSPIGHSGPPLRAALRAHLCPCYTAHGAAPHAPAGAMQGGPRMLPALALRVQVDALLLDQRVHDVHKPVLGRQHQGRLLLLVPVPKCMYGAFTWSQPRSTGAQPASKGRAKGEQKASRLRRHAPGRNHGRHGSQHGTMHPAHASGQPSAGSTRLRATKRRQHAPKGNQARAAYASGQQPSAGITRLRATKRGQHMPQGGNQARASRA